MDLRGVIRMLCDDRMMPRTLILWLLFVGVCVLPVGCSEPPSPRKPSAGKQLVDPAADTTDANTRSTPPVAAAPTTPAIPRHDPPATVVWLTIDGVRPDYLQRGKTPFFDRLMREGAYSLALKPVFPSLTFPCHVSQSTGVLVEMHGITSNAFYDAQTNSTYRYPAFASILESEPIWITASRQNVRTLVYDWPLSHGQRGDITAAYFGGRYIPGMSDDDRLQRMLRTWRNDEDQTPLRLLMMYIVGTDSIGHQVGPDANDVIETFERVDREVGAWFDEVVRIHEAKRPGAPLYVLITTDHGMARVDWVVHLERLTGIEGVEGVTSITGGNVGHVFLPRPAEGETFDDATKQQHQRLIADILDRVKQVEYAKAYRREDLPRAWGYAHPHRTGDVVVVADLHHTFSRRTPGPDSRAPVETIGGPLGMHGYDVKADPNMLGPAFLWRSDRALAGRNLGTIDSLQLHPTVAGLLGIDPAPNAKADPIHVNPQR